MEATNKLKKKKKLKTRAENLNGFSKLINFKNFYNFSFFREKKFCNKITGTIIDKIIPYETLREEDYRIIYKHKK